MLLLCFFCYPDARNSADKTHAGRPTEETIDLSLAAHFELFADKEGHEDAKIDKDHPKHSENKRVAGGFFHLLLALLLLHLPPILLAFATS